MRSVAVGWTKKMPESSRPFNMFILLNNRYTIYRRLFVCVIFSLMFSRCFVVRFDSTTASINDDEREEDTAANKSFWDLNSNNNTIPTERRRIKNTEKNWTKTMLNHEDKRKKTQTNNLCESLHSKLNLSMIDGWTATWTDGWLVRSSLICCVYYIVLTRNVASTFRVNNCNCFDFGPVLSHGMGHKAMPT